MGRPRARTSPEARSAEGKSATRATKSSRRATAAPDTTVAASAVAHALAANPLIGVRRSEMVKAAATLGRQLVRQPRVGGAQAAAFARELGRILAGKSNVTPASGDRRFADAAWTGNGGYRRLMQAYVALGSALEGCVDDANLDRTGRERARFVVSLAVDAIAPTNFLAGNPEALRRAAKTRGSSLLRGVANLIDDAASGRWLPKQVDARPFAVGKNLATSPGAVVFRNDLVELVQYAPTTPQVHARPLVIVPPQINKFYVFDLTPATSLVRAAVAQGVTTFCISWRNLGRRDAAIGLDDYVAALDEAAQAARDICGADAVNVFGACSGGITLSAWLGLLAARRSTLVQSATLAVCVLDTDTFRESTAGLFVTPATIAAARAASRKRGVLEGRDLARMFAWMRPNDLVWNYVVNNYLLGNDPPAHEILFWNSDTTRLPAQLHADFLALFENNALVARKLKVAARKIDLAKVAIDTYVVAGLADHITPWKGVYKTARLLGGARATFVLSNGGHIQSLVNPPGNKRSWFMAAPSRSDAPDRWLGRRAKVEGSWWPHWHAWLRARSGALRDAPPAAGNARHVPLCDAPGTYVHAC